MWEEDPQEVETEEVDLERWLEGNYSVSLFSLVCKWLLINRGTAGLWHF